MEKGFFFIISIIDKFPESNDERKSEIKQASVESKVYRGFISIQNTEVCVYAWWEKAISSDRDTP